MKRPLTWLEMLGEYRDSATPVVMVVVTHVEGSAPREASARMLVTPDGLAHGTIGGGNLERLAIERAQAMLGDASRGPESERYPLAEKAGQCCGGNVTLFFEPFRWKRRTVAIFGAGHVGQALAALAPWMQADVRLIDGRDEADLRPPVPASGERPYELVCVDAPEAEIDDLPDDALVLIMTHDHALDLVILERALRRGTFAYVGMIGSDRKWKRFEKRLLQKGLAADVVDTVRCPIGVSQASKAPTAIALSTATELVDFIARDAAV